MYNSINQLQSDIREKKTSVSEVTKAYLDRINEIDPKLNSYVAINEAAINQAAKADERLSKGDGFGPLEGVPVSLKDMFCTQGLKTTAGSNILKNFIPPYSATVVQQLEEAGAIILGKVNQDEFAMGSSCETSIFGSTKNPWDIEHVPGGSSGGSSASVASRTSLCSLGTDTGGSIRQPAHFCGLVGFKPTYGRVSRYGVIAFASSLDQPGPLALNVSDAFLMAQVISGKDLKDNTTANIEVPNWQEEIKNFSGSLEGKKFGVIKEFADHEVDPEIRDTFEKSKALLEEKGAKCVEVSLPLVKHGVSVYYLIATSEAASNLSRYDGIRYGHRAEIDSDQEVSLEDFYSKTRSEGFGEEVKRRILLGNFSLSSGYFDEYYKKACQVRRLIREQYLKAFSEVDFIISPVASTTAFKLNDRVKDPLKMFLNDYFTVSVNLAGLPGITVPIMKSEKGLPCGVQLIAPHFKESQLIPPALSLESQFKFYEEIPHV